MVQVAVAAGDQELAEAAAEAARRTAQAIYAAFLASCDRARARGRLRRLGV